MPYNDFLSKINEDKKKGAYYLYDGQLPEKLTPLAKEPDATK